MNDIFISIASYKDPELLPTIIDLLEKATNPDRITVGLAWQHGDEHDGKFPGQVRLLDIKAEESKGACWARARIQEELYDGQDYYMQLDSHHRFAQGWDDTLIDMLDECDSYKPVLTSYVPAYTPGVTPETEFNNLWGMRAGDFCKDTNVLLFFPATINKTETPIPARFMSGHFIFTYGDFVKQVPYDPNLYFHGEEITLAVRAWTHGWDMFHPNKSVVLHEYTREGRTKQWDDDKEWWKKDVSSKERASQLLLGQLDDEKYGLGNVRTLSEYQSVMQVDFEKCTVSKETQQVPYLKS